MRLVTRLALDDVRDVADRMGVELLRADDLGAYVRGADRGLNRLEVTIRPRGGCDRWRKVSPLNPWGGGRRVWACSWAGHYVFLRALLQRDPHLRMRSALWSFRGLSDFADRVMRTGEGNAGSMMSPVPHRELEAPGHLQWRSADTLDALARSYA